VLAGGKKGARNGKQVQQQKCAAQSAAKRCGKYFKNNLNS
jgi:hypothetical protein